MAKPARGSGGKFTAGVSNDGGSGEGGSDTGSGGNGNDSGSGDGGSGDGNVIRPTLNGGGDGDGGGDGGPGSGETRRGRGRPRGSASRPKTQLDVTTLSEVIAFAHVGLAAMLQNDAWTLDDGESKKLADAAARVLKHHDTPAFSAYAMDWLGLVMVAGNVYGPRVAMAMESASAKKATARQGAAPQPEQPSKRQEPRQPVARQGDGTVTISDPMGTGQLITIRQPG